MVRPCSVLCMMCAMSMRVLQGDSSRQGFSYILCTAAANMCALQAAFSPVGTQELTMLM